MKVSESNRTVLPGARILSILIGLLALSVLPLRSLGQTSSPQAHAVTPKAQSSRPAARNVHREEEAESYIEAAKDAQMRGDFDQAVAGYEAAIKLLPETPELYGNLGIAYYLQRDYPKAVVAFQQALKRKPNLEGPNLYLGMSYIRLSNFADSIKPLEKAIAVNPKLKVAYINLSASYNEVGKSEDALQVLQKGEKVFPNDEDILYTVGSQYYDMMFKAYKKMAEVAPNSYRYDQVLGKSFEERQEFGNAIVEYKQALKINPQAPGLHAALGNIYWAAGRYDDAIPEFEAELRIVPNDYMVTWKLGNIYLHEHKADKAQAYFEEAIRQSLTLLQATVTWASSTWIRTSTTRRWSICKKPSSSIPLS